MKPVYYAIILFVLICGCANRINVSKDWNPRTTNRIAVFDFDYVPLDIHLQNNSPLSFVQVNNPGKFIADSLTTVLMSSDYFTVIERSKIEKVLEELNLNMSEIIAKNEYQKIGELLGVDSIVVGNVSAMVVGLNPPFAESHIIFSCRCIDLKTGKVVWTMEVSEKSGESNPGIMLRPIMEQIKQELVTKIQQQLAQRK